MSLAALPADILFHVFETLAPLDILSIRQTCRILLAVTYERTIWLNTLCHNFFRQSLPVPGLRSRSLAQLSASELESLTFRALKLHRSWSSSEPKRTRTLQITPEADRDGPRSRCIAIYFLPGNVRALLSVTMHEPQLLPRSFSIQCWEVDQAQPICTAVYRCSYFLAVSINSDVSHPATIAITRRLLPGLPDDVPIVSSTMSIHFSRSNPNAAMSTLAEFPCFRQPLGLHGPLFIVSDNMYNIRILNAESGDPLYVLRVPNPHNDLTWNPEEYKCMGVIVLDQFILTFCQRWIHLYLLPSGPSEYRSRTVAATTSTMDLDPAAGYKWQWRIDSLVVSRQNHGPSTSSNASRRIRLDPINLFVRFDTWYPWPVNILHHFVLPPNPTYSPSAFSHFSHHPLPSPGDLPYLFSSSANVFGPYMANSVASPMRLFTPSDMVLGKYGTALWIDAQTDANSPSQAGDHGQRIAGKILSIPNPRYVKYDPSNPLGGEGGDQVSPGFVDFQPGAHLGDSNDGANDEFGRQEKDNPIMVFEVRENYDGWNRLALDEEEGRVAVGSVDGSITVFDYAPLQHGPGQATPSTQA